MSMKYVINDSGNVAVGPESTFHADLLESIGGRLESAAQYQVNDGKVSTFGQSYGFGTVPRPEDAEIIQRHLQ